MEVKLKPFGCAERLGCIFSLGLLPIMIWMQRKIAPALVNEQEMVLRNGKHILWTSFTRVKATNVYYKQTQVRTHYDLIYNDGKVAFDSDKIVNAQDVIPFILSHLPRAAFPPK